jgi:protein-S-isoprenylcysteine O-methyltransferase Ste14
MSVRLFLFNLVSGVLFLAAAVFAEGGARAFFADPALAGFFFVTIALYVAASFTKGNLSSGVREDRGNRWVLAAFFALGAGLIVVPLGLDRRDVMTVDGEAVRWLGLALYPLGGALRIVPVFVLGRRFSGLVAIQQGHELVTDGLYAKIRNPSYLGLIVSSVGLALVFRSLPGVVISLLFLWPLHARMKAEERLLEQTFGDKYRAYRSRTSRLIPGVY